MGLFFKSPYIFGSHNLMFFPLGGSKMLCLCLLSKIHSCLITKRLLSIQWYHTTPSAGDLKYYSKPKATTDITVNPLQCILLFKI